MSGSSSWSCIIILYVLTSCQGSYISCTSWNITKLPLSSAESLFDVSHPFTLHVVVVLAVSSAVNVSTIPAQQGPCLSNCIKCYPLRLVLKDPTLMNHIFNGLPNYQNIDSVQTPSNTSCKIWYSSWPPVLQLVSLKRMAEQFLWCQRKESIFGKVRYLTSRKLLVWNDSEIHKIMHFL